MVKGNGYREKVIEKPCATIDSKLGF